MTPTITVTEVKTETKELVEGGEFERILESTKEPHKQIGYRSHVVRFEHKFGTDWVLDTAGHVHMKSQLKAL